MAQIELVYVQQTEKQLKQVFAELEKHQKKLIEISNMSIDFYGKKTASNPNDLKNSIATIDKLNKKIKEQDALLKKLKTTQNEVSKSQVSKQKQIDKLYSDREKQINKQIALENKRKSEIEKAYAQEEKRIQKIANLEKKAQAQRELQVKKESDLRQRLLAQKKKEEAQSLKQSRSRQALNKQREKSIALNAKITSQWNQLNAKLQKAELRFKNLAASQGLSNKQTKRARKEMLKLRNRIDRINVSAKRFNGNVGNYPKGLRAATGAIRNFASALGLLGGAFLVVQGIKSIFNTIRQFDKQLVAVRKTTNLTSSEIKLFAKDVVALGLATKGVSIQGLLKSSEIAGQLGIRGSKNILKFSKTIEQLKLTSNISGEESARAFAKFIEISKDTVENADKLGSVITGLGNDFATTETEILSNALEIQRASAIYEVSAESALALGAATSSMGIQAEASRSAFLRTFKVLESGISTGKNLERILSLTGQTAAEFKEEFGRDATSVFQKFIKGLRDAKDSGQSMTVILKELKLDGQRVLPVLGTLATKYETLDRALESSNDLYKENNALSKEAGLAAKSLDSQIGDLSDSWDGFVLSLDNGEGVFSRVVKGFIGGINSILEGFRLLNISTKEYNKGLQDNVFDKRLKEMQEFFKDNSKDSKKFAIQLADEARDRIDQINAEIKLLTDKNKVLKEGRGTASSIAFDRNEEQLERLSEDLGLFKAQLKASEEQIEFTDKSLKKLNKTGEDAEAITIKNIKLLRKKIKQEQENIENIDLEVKGNIAIINQKQKLIKGYKAEIDAILGTASARKKANKVEQDTFAILEGTIPFYEEIIRGLKAQQTQLSRTREEWFEFQIQIDEFVGRLEGLKNSLNGVSSAMEGTAKAVELLDKIVDGFNLKAPLEDAEPEWKKTFGNIVNVAQQAFGIITALSDASFAKQFANLEKQRNFSISFAGESAEAQANVDEIYARKKAAIETKQAEAKKRQAIFEIILNTASAVVEALPTVPLAIAVGALGAIQLGLVASQQIPAFHEGTLGTPQGQILVNDDPYGKKGSNYKEVVKEPKGKLHFPKGKNVKMNVPKGSTVFPTYDAFMQSLDMNLLNNNIMPIGKESIMPMVVNNGITKGEIADVMNNHSQKMVNAIGKQSGLSVHIDENGLHKFAKKQGVTTKIMNSRWSGRGTSV